jgi:hypothetical protein
MNKSCVKAMNKLLPVEKMGSHYSGLDSSYLYVRDLNDNSISDDNSSKMNIWMLENVEKAELLKIVLKPDDLLNTCAIIVLDFDQPWDMMSSLEKWMNVLRDTILALLPQLPFS